MASFPDVSDALHPILATHPNSRIPFTIPVRPARILRAALTHPLPTRLQLPRSPIPLDVFPLPSDQGMSPKKAHEVTRMASYILHLVRAADLSEKTLRIVDIGAGQGYLTRALKSLLPTAHILALDADLQQTEGAQRWERRLLPHAQPPIAHRTILIEPRTLLTTLDEWIGTSDCHVPVIFVALHACGSLTPDVLRAFIAVRRSPAIHWYPAATVAVGCCYNLMRPLDFPLSKQYLSLPTPLDLPPSAFHLAAQIPSTWAAQTEPCLKLHDSASLAIRKVVWRALLERALPHAIPLDASAHPPSTPNPSATVPAHWPRRPEDWDPSTPKTITTGDVANAHLDPTSGIGLTSSMRRLGRLRDAAYTSWAGFLAIAGEKMGLDFSSPEVDGLMDDEELKSVLDGNILEQIIPNLAIASLSDRDDNDDELEMSILGPLPPSLLPQARQLAALHILRCLVGPVVESAILKDRVQWFEDEIGASIDNGRVVNVELVNLFDQATGSGRNVAIVIRARAPASSGRVVAEAGGYS